MTVNDQENPLVSLQSNIRFGGEEGLDTDYTTLLLGVTILTP